MRIPKLEKLGSLGAADVTSTQYQIMRAECILPTKAGNAPAEGFRLDRGASPLIRRRSEQASPGKPGPFCYSCRSYGAQACCRRAALHSPGVEQARVRSASTGGEDLQARRDAVTDDTHLELGNELPRLAHSTLHMDQSRFPLRELAPSSRAMHW